MVMSRTVVRLIRVFLYVGLLASAFIVPLSEQKAQPPDAIYRARLATIPATSLTTRAQPAENSPAQRTVTPRPLTSHTEFSISYNPTGRCTNPQNWPQDAQDGFQAVMDIWGSILNITQTVTVFACYQPDADPTTLASAAPVTSPDTFTGAPITNTTYAVALANQLAGTDLNGTDFEIDANVNSQITWYFKGDTNVPANQFDFVSTMLHEVAHGLGFLDSTGFDCNGVPNTGCYQVPPTIYDRFMFNGTGDQLIDTNIFNNDSVSLGNQLISDNLFFVGTNATRLNNATSPGLYAPNPYAFGSSIGHLDDNIFPTALMASATGPGLSSRFPTPATLGILQDIGWSVNILSLLNTVSTRNATAGQTITFTLRAINSDINVKSNIVITDTVPSNTTLLPTSLSGDATFTGVTAGSIITWNTGTTLNQSQILTRTFTVQINADAPGGQLVNTAWVSAEIRAASNTISVNVAGNLPNKIFLPLVLSAN